MKSTIAMLILLAAASFANPLCASAAAQEMPATSNGLRALQTIPLPNVEGRIDHMGVDLQGQRLFVSALGNNTLEVLDLRESKRLTSIKGLKEPQGVFFVPKENKLFVGNSTDGTCVVLDGSSYKVVETIHFSSDADNVRYDADQNQINLQSRLEHPVLDRSFHGCSAPSRWPVGFDRTTRSGPSPQTSRRQTTHLGPCLSDWHHVRTPKRDPVADVAAGDGLRFRDDLLAVAT